MADFEKVYTIKFNTKQAQSAIKRLDKGIGKIDTAAFDAGRKLNRFIGVKGVKAFNSLNDSVKRSRKSVDSLNNRFKRVGQTMSRIGSKMNRWITLPLVGAGIASLKMGMDFNKGMARVGTLIPGNQKRIQELKTGIQELSMATGIATSDLTDGTYSAISAWGDSADTLDKLKVVAMAAQAGLSTTEETLGLVTSITSLYGDTSKEATERLADFAFVANKLAIKAPFGEMAVSMGKVAALGKQIGVSQKQLFATMAAASGITGNVSEVSTQMSSLYTALIKETPQMTDVIKKHNKEMGTSFETASEAAEGLGVVKFLKYIKGATKNTKEFQKVLGGRKEGAILAYALLGERADKYNEALEEMDKRSGQMREAHKEITDGVNKQGHSWEKTKARIMVFTQRLGDKLLPALDKILDKLEPVFKYIENMSESTIDAWLAAGKWAITLGLATKGLGGVLSMVTSLGALRNLNTGMAGLNASTHALNGNLASTATGMNNLKKLSLGSASALLAAAAAGYTLGTAIHEIFLDPHNKARVKKQEGLMGLADTTGRVMAGGTTEEKEAHLKKLTTGRAQYKKEAGAAGTEDIAGGVMAAMPWSDIESPSEKRQRTYSATDTAIQKTRKSLEADYFERWMDKGTGGFQTSEASKPASVTNFSPTINNTTNVNGGNINEKKLAKEQSRNMSRLLKNASSQLPQGQN